MSDYASGINYKRPTLDELKQGGVKMDQDKIRLDLLPFEALMAVGEVLTFGAKKYADNNWRKGIRISRLIGGALRHCVQFMCGEDKDKESGLSHLAHMACCVLFALTFVLEKRTDLDDRHKHENRG